MNEQKIDKRRNYIMILDTETANSTNSEGKVDPSSAFAYDIGFIVCDTKGNIYESYSFVNKDIFFGEADLMQSSYYKKKLPQYHIDIAEGTRTLATTYEIRYKMIELIEKYGIKAVAAYNARFDYNTLNSTERWTTKSKYRYWFPYDSVEIWDIMKMARDIICKMPTYSKFCEAHNLYSANGRCSQTAETMYRFITKNPTFEEEHTGLADVLIEKEIYDYCRRQKKAMRKLLWETPKN